MSLKDDFFEALNSVKKDMLYNSSDNSYLNENEDDTAGSEMPEDAPPPDSVGIQGDNAANFSAGSEDGSLHSDRPFSIISSSSPPSDYSTEDTSGGAEELVYGSSEIAPYNSENSVYDIDRSGIYNDERTVISKNTVINGSLKTDDSLRLLGQVLGDIDCKSNIVVAGKVRGNTSAANAYIMDAQIDGNLHCDDVVSVSTGAWILGDVRAQQAEIDGKVKGNLDVRHTLCIGSNSSVIGNISADELEIKRGAFVNGQIMMYTASRDVLDRFDHFEK